MAASLLCSLRQMAVSTNALRLLVCVVVILYTSQTYCDASSVRDRAEEEHRMEGVVVHRHRRQAEDSQVGTVDYEALLRQAQYNPAIRKVSTEPVVDPDCWVEISEPRMVGGRCGRVRGGLRYCAVRGFVYVNHDECMDDDTEPEEE